MKIKITKRTIETILWLLGQLITLTKQVSKENKGSEIGEIFENSADAFLGCRWGMLVIKNKKRSEDNEEKVSKKNPKGN